MYKRESRGYVARTVQRADFTSCFGGLDRGKGNQEVTSVPVSYGQPDSGIAAEFAFSQNVQSTCLQEAVSIMWCA